MSKAHTAIAAVAIVSFTAQFVSIALSDVKLPAPTAQAVDGASAKPFAPKPAAETPRATPNS